MKKIVLTGAAGALGRRLREPLTKLSDTLLSTDIADGVGELLPGENYSQADVSDLDTVMGLLDGAEMVVHFGAIADEAPFDEILKSNIVGAYNVFEAAYRQGVKRVVYASSIHAVGMYPKTQNIDANVPHRPDGYYGLSKCFAEDLARLYWDKRGLEAVCLRILSCSPVKGHRSLGSWLSYDDLVRLVTRCVDTPATGFAIVYGISNNDRAVVDNAAASFLGYKPQDNAEQFAEEILAASGPYDPQDPGEMCHGGPFAKIEMGESGVAAIKRMAVKKDP